MLKKAALDCVQALRLNPKLVGGRTPSQNDAFVRRYATAKRFYKKTNVVHSNGKFEITLDQRKLKTPKGNLFFVESEPLALAVAAEWDAQKTHIIPSKMHLFGLCSTALDNPGKQSKEDIAENIIRYLDTDTVLYFSSDEDELYSLELNEWLPIVNWFCKRFDVEIQPSKCISGPKISAYDKEILRKHLLSYNFWALHGVIFAVEALKSVILALSCVERHVSVEKATALSRLEEEYQVRRRESAGVESSGRMSLTSKTSRQEYQQECYLLTLIPHHLKGKTKKQGLIVFK